MNAAPNRQHAQAIAEQGVEALVRGDTATARMRFEHLVATGLADTSVWFALGATYLRLGELAAAGKAADNGLQLEPGNTGGLIFRADIFDAQGDARAAVNFYQAALRSVPNESTLPDTLKAELARARQACTRHVDALEAAVQKRLAAIAAPGGRVSEAVDILFGRRTAALSSPRYFYFPGLASRAFHDRTQFPWLGELERHTEAIAAEAAALLDDPACFAPYVQSRADRARHEQGGMADNADWSACYLYRYGVKNDEIARRCPATMRAIDSIPLVWMPQRSPSVLFSLLKPGAHIPPHNGLVNTRLIGHLPLIVPAGCRFRVGNDTREWRPGEAWLFDDSIEHEAWNGSDRLRVILIFEVWRPDLSEAERAAVCEIFAAIDEHAGVAPAWEI